MIFYFIKEMLIDDVITILCNAKSVGGEYAEKIGIIGNNLNIYFDIETYVARFILNGFSKDNRYEADKYVKWIDNFNIDIIKNEINKGYGVITSIYMRDNNNRKVGGHILYIVGYTEDTFIIMDTYGNWYTKYKETNGYLVEYSFDTLKQYNKNKMMFIHADLENEVN